MPKYYFLYKGSLTGDQIFQSYLSANTEEETRDWFSRHYNAELVTIRKGREFSKSEIEKKRKQLRYGK